MPEARVHVTVTGRVQGVGFRHFVTQQARLLSLAGWVRNTPSGDVEVVAEGDRPAVERLLELLAEGPRLARVSRLDTDWEPPTGQFSDFRVIG